MNENYKVAVIHHIGLLYADSDDYYIVMISKSKTGTYFGDGDDQECLAEGTEAECVQYCIDNKLHYLISH